MNPRFKRFILAILVFFVGAYGGGNIIPAISDGIESLSPQAVTTH